jgi:ABC-type lipoprotein release transport system permease subunit
LESADTLPPDAHWTPRVRVNAVGANARHSRGITLVGIDPRREARVSFIADAVTRGRYLQPKDPYGAIVGKALAETFETETGNKLVLMSQDRSGEIASRAFRIVGIFRAETEAVEEQYVFVHLDAAQEMLSMGGDICEISILLAQDDRAPGVAETLRSHLNPDQYVVFTWRELLPMVRAVLRMYDGFILIWFLTVFIAMGFGLVNTILMAVFERIREFGLLRAMGMKPGWVIGEVLSESFFLLVMGLAAGNLLGTATVAVTAQTGIDLSAFAEGMEFVGMSRVIIPVLYLRDLITANLTVLILGLLISLYPAIKAARIKPVEAMAHV